MERTATRRNGVGCADHCFAAIRQGSRSPRGRRPCIATSSVPSASRTGPGRRHATRRQRKQKEVSREAASAFLQVHGQGRVNDDQAASKAAHMDATEMRGKARARLGGRGTNPRAITHRRAEAAAAGALRALVAAARAVGARGAAAAHVRLELARRALCSRSSGAPR